LLSSRSDEMPMSILEGAGGIMLSPPGWPTSSKDRSWSWEGKSIQLFALVRDGSTETWLNNMSKGAAVWLRLVEGGDDTLASSHCVILV
jgi:hypothetical protein